jgi:hypothetical protein
MNVRHGATAPAAFLDGYHDGLLVTVGLLVFGAVVGYIALRGSQQDHDTPELESTVAVELAGR